MEQPPPLKTGRGTTARSCWDSGKQRYVLLTAPAHGWSGHSCASRQLWTTEQNIDVEGNHVHSAGLAVADSEAALTGGIGEEGKEDIIIIIINY